MQPAPISQPTTGSPRLGPHPWLTICISLATLSLAALKIYLDVRHWKEPNTDLMPVAISFVFTMILWIALALAVWLNLRDYAREKRLRVYITTLKEEHRTQIEGRDNAFTKFKGQSEEAALTSSQQLDIRIAAEKEASELAKRRLNTLKACAYDLQTAGQLTLLAEDALEVSAMLDRIVVENSTDPNPLDLSIPLSSSLVQLSSPNDLGLLSWQRIRLMSLRDRYNIHRQHVIDRSLHDFNSEIVKYAAPLDGVRREDLQKRLSDHRKALRERAGSLAKPYLDALGREGV